MSEKQAENLKTIGGILQKKNEEIRRLQEENALLRAEHTQAQAQQDKEDAEVFRLVHSKPTMSAGCQRLVLHI